MEYSQIPSTQLPEDVLEQFVANLRDSIRRVEDLLPSLLEMNGQNEGKVTFSQLDQTVLTVNQNIAWVIDYLHSRLRNNNSETGDVAESILAAFTQELREWAAPLMGYIAICEQPQLSEDRLEHFIKVVMNLGKI
jgi:hypothetical protein